MYATGMVDIAPAAAPPRPSRYKPVTRKLPELPDDPFGATYRGKLTPELQRKLCAAIAWGGMGIREICRAHGIQTKTYYTWLKRGREGHSGKFVNFVEAVENAKAVFEQRATDAIAAAGFVGSRTVAVREITELDADTGEEVVVKRETTTTDHPPDVKPLQWLLTKREPERYADKLVTENTTKMQLEQVSRVEVTFVETGVLDGAIDVVDVDSVPVLDVPVDPLDPDPDDI